MAVRPDASIEWDAAEDADNKVDKPSILKRAWFAVRDAVRAETFLGSFLRANILTAILSAALLLLFFAFPPLSTGIMLELGTALGMFAFWTQASSYAGAVSVVVAETYAVVLATVMTLFGIADGVQKLVNFCKREPDAVSLESKMAPELRSEKPTSGAQPKHVTLFSNKAPEPVPEFEPSLQPQNNI